MMDRPYSTHSIRIENPYPGLYGIWYDYNGLLMDDILINYHNTLLDYISSIPGIRMP